MPDFFDYYVFEKTSGGGNGSNSGGCGCLVIVLILLGIFLLSKA